MDQENDAGASSNNEEYPPGEPSTSQTEVGRISIPPPPPFPVSIQKMPLVNGHQMPLIGIETCKSDFGDNYKIIRAAIDIGFRYFDCSSVNGNEIEIGSAIASKIEQGIVTRDELFISAKISNCDNHPDLVQQAINATLQNLQIDYLDLYLIGDCEKNDYVKTWKSLEYQVENGHVRSIGVTNFNEAKLDRLYNNAEIPIAANQVECNPFITQVDLSEFCSSKNIVLTIYNPFGNYDDEIGEIPVLREMSERYEKTVGQILLKYQLQRGHVPLIKVSKISKMLELINIFDFDLTPEDVELIGSFNCEPSQKEKPLKSTRRKSN